MPVRRLPREDAVIPLDWFPPLNATLNGLSGLCLIAGIGFIKRKNIPAHKACMLTALMLSLLFLACYITYHTLKGGLATRFDRQGWVHTLYLTILISHTLLAVTVPFLAGRTVWLAWKGRIDGHKRIAKWTFPIWLYVSVTGVIVYWMLYKM